MYRFKLQCLPWFLLMNLPLFHCNCNFLEYFADLTDYLGDVWCRYCIKLQLSNRNILFSRMHRNQLHCLPLCAILSPQKGKLGFSMGAYLDVEVCIAVMQQVIGGLAETADSADQLRSVHGHRMFHIHPFHPELHSR